jgi:hypothetical protein
MAGTNAASTSWWSDPEFDPSTMAKLNALTGAEHFLVGLTPHYWAHIPMLIADVWNLGLVNGVSCIVVLQHPEEDAKGAGSTASLQFIPVSKCTLVGVVVNVDHKSNGSILYLIDDGTGLMDCLLWNRSDYYKLPSLLHDDHDEMEGQEEEDCDMPRFAVGDIVRLRGRLHSVCRSGLRTKYCDAVGTVWESHNCVREVHVTHMEFVAKPRNPRHLVSDPEHDHWMKCVAWRHKYGRKTATTIQNGVDALRLLGPKIAQDALDKTDFPSAGDDVGSWRVFGTSCACDLPYKEPLLYCHCQATAEPLDPYLTFRDALLLKLLHMEQSNLTSDEPLQFAYQMILHDTQLQEVAQNACQSPTVPFHRVVLKTFAALRKDGIVHLVDPQADHYLFISRARVIEPHIRRKANHDKSQLNVKLLQLERQSALRNVPHSRINHVKRCIEKGNMANVNENDPLI